MSGRGTSVRLGIVGPWRMNEGIRSGKEWEVKCLEAEQRGMLVMGKNTLLHNCILMEDSSRLNCSENTTGKKAVDSKRAFNKPYSFLNISNYNTRH